MPHVILGIGNYDEKYWKTRHNIGWMVVDALSDKMGQKFRKAGFEFWAAEGRLDSQEVVLVKTWTYVNRTGNVLPEIRKKWGDDILVVCDDIALELGSVRFREKGSSGGHNGLQSIINALGGNGFSRLRLGVGGGRPNPNYVLGRFPKADLPVLEETLEYSLEAIGYWTRFGTQKTMNRYNRIRKEKDEHV
ncbi:MAG: aminoacyl-tRNA hydrolase [Planctomycetota bacterium]|nr:aminoacyl-tRNA hydrolase [Planctomycetota bacterium]